MCCGLSSKDDDMVECLGLAPGNNLMKWETWMFIYKPNIGIVGNLPSYTTNKTF